MGTPWSFTRATWVGAAPTGSARWWSDSDFVIIVTDVNSHGAVLLAKKMAQQVGRGSLVIRRCGSSRFQALLDAINLRETNLLEQTA